MIEFEGDSMERWSDDRLLREASNGNEDAFGVFCVRAIPALRRYVRFQCRSRDVPNDLVTDFCQQTLSRAIEHVRTNRPGSLPKVPAAWLNRIAHNLIADWCRRERKMSFFDDIEIEAPETSAFEDDEEQEQILKFFTWLSDNDRDLLEMVLVEELTIEEAGSRIGLNKWGAHKAYQRALAHLRDLLKEHGLVPEWAVAGD